MNSCSKDVCYTCTSSYDKTNICEDDYNSKDDFNNAKNALELTGYTCKRKW
jgi:hypothetical protein